MDLATALELAVLAVVVAAVTSMVWHTLAVGISPMPTSPKVKRVLLELLPADAEGEVHELGAAWGTLAFALADRCPRARVIAWERSPVPYLALRLRQALWPRPNLELRRRDFFEASFAQASLVVCYLWTGAMERLGPKLAAELRPGAVVVSHTFALRGVRPAETRRAADLYRTPVYRYVAPFAPIE